MAKKTRNAIEILERLTGDDPELREMIAEEAVNAQVTQDHIVVFGDLHHGEPCIQGTRIPVKTLIGSLADGLTPAEILEEYPQLKGLLSPEAQADLWQSWIEKGPQGPIEDEEDSELP